MKTAAIIRIIVGAAAAILLLVLLVSILSGHTIFHNGRIDISTESDPSSHAVSQPQTASGKSSQQAAADLSSVQNSDNQGAKQEAAGYTAGGAAVAMDRVNEIEIEWVAGLVNLNVGTGSEITFSETSTKQLTDSQTLRYSVRENKLIISYCEKTAGIWNWLDVDKLNMPSKDLTLTVPADLMDGLKEIQVSLVSADLVSTDVRARSLEVESVSGDISVSGMTGEELDVQTVNGKVEIKDMSVRSLDAECVSGRLTVSGIADSVDTEVTSADTVLTLGAAPRKLDMDSVSGTIRVSLPADANHFTAKLDSVSGDLTSDFPSVMKNGRFVVGNGTAEYDFETISGDVELIMQ